MTIKAKMTRDKERDSKNEESLVQIFVQQMLVTRVFVATYTGRNYVQPLKDYRDVLKVDEAENDLIRDLEIVRKRINNLYRGAMWAAITGPDDTEPEALAGVCVWTSLDNVAFGSYWFMIQNVYFSEHGELVLNIKVVRKYEPDAKTTETTFNNSMNWDEIKTNLLSYTQVIGASMTKNIGELLSWHNIKESSRFIFLLLLTIGTGMLYGLQYLGDYSIKFFREFNNFIKVMTPIFIAIIDMVSKTIGGFYLLLVMLWRGNNQAPMTNFPSLMGAPSQQQFKPQNQRRFVPGYRKDNYYY